mgnify:CR=1
MRDYKFRQVEPSFRKRKRSLVKPVLLVFTLALALGLAIAFAPSWLGWPSYVSEQTGNPDVIPLSLPPQPARVTEPE